MSRSFAGEKTPAKASILPTLKEDQQGRKRHRFCLLLRKTNGGENGMYLYQVLTNGKLIKSNRLIIIK